MMKKCFLFFFIVAIGSAAGWYINRVEAQIKDLKSHAALNSNMANRSEMMMQLFFDTAPREIIRIIRDNKCQCGHSKPRTITSLNYDDQ